MGWKIAQRGAGAIWGQWGMDDKGESPSMMQGLPGRQCMQWPSRDVVRGTCKEQQWCRQQGAPLASSWTSDCNDQETSAVGCVVGGGGLSIEPGPSLVTTNGGWWLGV
jgi:hypothetical protein